MLKKLALVALATFSCCSVAHADILTLTERENSEQMMNILRDAENLKINSSNLEDFLAHENGSAENKKAAALSISQGQKYSDYTRVSEGIYIYKGVSSANQILPNARCEHFSGYGICTTVPGSMCDAEGIGQCS